MENNLIKIPILMGDGTVQEKVSRGGKAALSEYFIQLIFVNVTQIVTIEPFIVDDDNYLTVISLLNGKDLILPININRFETCYPDLLPDTKITKDDYSI